MTTPQPITNREDTNTLSNDATQKYLFDLNGYLILEDVLSADEVARLNAIMDEQNLPEPGLTTASARFGSSQPEQGSVSSAGFLDWGTEFTSLLDNDRVMNTLRWVLGDGFRVDHLYGIHMRNGTEGLPLHGGATPYDPPEFFRYAEGEVYNGLTVVSFNLTDTGRETGGGFMCIPGSHKSNYAVPDEYMELSENAPPVINPEVKAGSVVIFTEALTHGTAPWCADHIRRSLLFKFSPAQQSWGPNYMEPPANVPLTDRQKLLFEKPYFAKRKSLFN